MSKMKNVGSVLIASFFSMPSVVFSDDDEVLVYDREQKCQMWWYPTSVENGGTFSWAGGCEDGKLHGKGEIQVFYKGNKYVRSVGEYRKGKRHGESEYFYENGAHAVYEFDNGKAVSYKFSDIDGDIIEVDKIFPDSKLGVGRITYKDGGRYIGDIKNRKSHGEGEYMFSNGDRYEGSFVEGKRHGEGKFIFADGTSYKGLWEYGVRIKIFD